MHKKVHYYITFAFLIKIIFCERILLHLGIFPKCLPNECSYKIALLGG